MTEVKKTRAPMIDYSALEVSEVPATRVRPASVESTPFVKWYAELREKPGTGKSFKVPDGAVTQTENLLRRAAQVVDPVNGGIVIGKRPIGNGFTEISFRPAKKKQFDASKPRKPRNPKRRKNETPAEYRKRQEQYKTALANWEKANGGQ